MSRKVKDAMQNGERIYFRGHAGATYMSDGNTVEKAMENVAGSIPKKVSDLTNDAGYATMDAVAEGYSPIGCATSESLSGVPVDKRLCVCTVSASGSFSLASVPAAGREVHVIVSNTGDSDIAVALPNTGEYVCLTDTALSVKAGGYAEINVISDGSRMYIRSI